MNVIPSRINTRDPEFTANRVAMQTLVDNLRESFGTIAEGGGERSRERHLSRGKLLPRDRVEGLLDPGAPFLELSQHAAYGMYDD